MNVSINKPTTRSTKTAKFCWICCLCAVAVYLTTGVDYVHASEPMGAGVCIKATATASETAVRIAEPFELTIEVVAPDGVTVRFPKVGSNVGEFEVVDFSDSIDIPSVDGRKSIRQMTLESLKTGELIVPALDVYFADRRADEPQFEMAKTNSIPVSVQSLISDADDPSQFRDLKNVVFLKESQPSTANSWGGWVFFGSVGVSGIVVLMLTGWYPKRLNPKLRALRDLDQLFNSQSFTSGDSRLVYDGTTCVLRQFIQSQFELPATRQTTEEFLRALNTDDRLDESLRGQLELFMSSADMVKFAGLSCPREVLCEAIDKARQVVIQADKLSRSTLAKTPHGRKETGN